MFEPACLCQAGEYPSGDRGLAVGLQSRSATGAQGGLIPEMFKRQVESGTIGPNPKLQLLPSTK